MKIKGAFFLVLYFFSLTVKTELNGVGLLTQYYLGKNYILSQKECSEKDVEAFLLGVWFPGIWYISEIKNSVSQKNCGLQEIEGERDSFKKGILFHKYLHEKEKAFLKDTLFHDYFPKNYPYEIKECYLNILEDLLFTATELPKEAKQLLNHSLYENFSLENFSSDYPLSEIIKWYFTIFISLDTPPLEIINEMSTQNTYKGVGVTLEITDQIIKEAHLRLPSMAIDEELRSILEKMLQKIQDDLSI